MNFTHIARDCQIGKFSKLSKVDPRRGFGLVVWHDHLLLLGGVSGPKREKCSSSHTGRQHIFCHVLQLDKLSQQFFCLYQRDLLEHFCDFETTISCEFVSRKIEKGEVDVFGEDVGDGVYGYLNEFGQGKYCHPTAEHSRVQHGTAEHGREGDRTA